MLNLLAGHHSAATPKGKSDRDVNPQLIQVAIQFNSCHIGLNLTSLLFPSDSICIGLIRLGQLILASANPTINCRDKILILALNPSLAPSIKCMLSKTHPLTWSAYRCSI
jgi:hypothetical protein